MSFTEGFLKTAAKNKDKSGIFSHVGELGSHGFKGLKESGKASLKDVLALKELKHLGDAAKSSGGADKLFTSRGGRKNLARALGKAAPSIGALGAYGYLGKKIYDKINEPNANAYAGYY